MTASRRLKDLKTAGWKFIAFAILCPNLFATIGMLVAHCYSYVIGEPFHLGTYRIVFGVVRRGGVHRRPAVSGWRFLRPAQPSRRLMLDARSLYLARRLHTGLYRNCRAHRQNLPVGVSLWREML